jgi:hypothetical protein
VKAVWKRWVALFEDEDPAAPHYDPVHLAVVLVATQVAIGCLYWLLWTVFVYEGGVAHGLRLANVVALLVCSLTIAALEEADRRHRASRK